jgi:SAM-dependent methyltransferase
MFERWQGIVDRLELLLLNRLMLRASRRKPSEAGTADGQHHKFLDLLRSLLSARGVKFGPALVPSLRSMLVDQIPASAWSVIPSLEKRDAPVMNTWAFQNDVMKWDIGEADLVLDVGAGGFPFKRADHLADRYPDETTHRMEAMVRDARPFFEVDLQSLPFADKTYDFVFCSHVLEHLDHPGQAIRELMRVGKRGYIEVPTRLSDVMFNFTRLPDHHRWHGMMLGKTLVLVEWNDVERRELGSEFFNALHSEYRSPFQDFFERNRDLFFASCHWQETIGFMIIDKTGRVIDASFDDVEHGAGGSH